MGVYGLLSHCLERRQECAEFVDLIQVARENETIEILVDFYSFEHLILNNLWKALSSRANNPYLKFLGGEYMALDEYLRKLIKDLQTAGINLVMFVDGGKGSSKLGTEQKLETWKFRHRKDMTKVHDIVSALKGARHVQSLPDDASVRPVLLEVQFFATLKDCKCEVVQCPSGEADYVIARNLVSRPKAYAIISNDSDFCIFKDCKFIPNQLFDLQNDLQLGGSQVLPPKPERLVVGVISAGKVVSLLQLEHKEHLVEVSIIAGNDFTASHVKNMKGKLGIKGRDISHVADWVRTQRRVENHPVVAMEMSHNGHFAEAVERSRQFYGLTMDCQPEPTKGLLTHFLEEGIRQGNYPVNLMAMHRNFYWHRMLLEDAEYGLPCVEVALGPLRSFVYRMVLSRQDHVVIEYGRTPYEELATATLNAADARTVPLANDVNKDKMFRNLSVFHRVMTHMEPNFQTEWHKRYGWRVGCICYTLRYFMVLNTGANLHLRVEEFIPIAAMIFSKLDEPWYQSLAIAPSMRCVTIGNWFQDLYRHVYDFLGKLLYLSHEFSPPKSVFSGAVWTAFYMMSTKGDMFRQSNHLPRHVIQRIWKDMDNILKEKRHMLRYIVEGYYDLNAALSV